MIVLPQHSPMVLTPIGLRLALAKLMIRAAAAAAAAAGPTATCLVVHWTDFPLGYYMDSAIGVSRHDNVCVFGAWVSSQYVRH